MSKTESRVKVYQIPIRSIVSNTNPRQALSGSLDLQGWTVFVGEKTLWPLATSDNPEERAKYVSLLQDFDPDLVSMAATMLTQGQLQPVEVREGGGKNVPYTLVYGCRRCLAILFNWCLLGKPKDPVVNATLVKGAEGVLLQRAIVENIRKNPSPIEEAQTIKMLVNNGQGKDEVAKELGMSMSTLVNRLALLDLDPKTQAKIKDGRIKPTAALQEERHERNGTTQADKPRIRSRKEILEAAEEFREGTVERRVLDWMLCRTEKIK